MSNNSRCVIDSCFRLKSIATIHIGTFFRQAISEICVHSGERAKAEYRNVNSVSVVVMAFEVAADQWHLIKGHRSTTYVKLPVLKVMLLSTITLIF